MSLTKRPTFETFPRAPVIEAVIDIQITGRSVHTNTTLESVVAALKADYPVVQARQELSASIRLDEDGLASTKSDSRSAGFILRSAADPWAIILQRGSLTVSRQEPYTSWDELTRVFTAVWTAYTAPLEGTTISRAACRYINRIVVPSGQFEWEDYFNIRINLPISAPYVSQHIALRTSIASDGVSANVALQTEGTDSEGRSPVVFDIDCYKNLNIANSSIADLSEVLNDLRSLKNRLFFECITTKTKELFK